ncbi:hypothetical protein EPYR_00046 [Erwinia pyrifoliae DSM 12163]|nr:hypothetical protein EJP617_12180 [Erwinia sp. Ejp617]CAY72325.1 hypothetical protein EPYR_00046 [Erwinia pyrifoliae DSM 12163]
MVCIKSAEAAFRNALLPLANPYMLRFTACHCYDVQEKQK